MTALFEIIETVMKDISEKSNNAATAQEIKKPVSDTPTKATN